MRVDADNRSIDYIRQSYDLIGEPLNLSSGGQQWFTTILSHEYDAVPGANGLVLGATPWLSAHVAKIVDKTAVVDLNPKMLDMCKRAVHCNYLDAERQIAFLNGNWLALPNGVRNVQLVVGDNSLAFLEWPGDWEEVADLLRNRMVEGGVLICRFLSVPAEHRRLRPKEIVDAALTQRGPLNYTAVRVALLFAHWDEANYQIRPEAALSTFDRERGEFERLFNEERSNLENDLLSIEKYRGTDALFFAPPLAEVISMFEQRFMVRAIYFGPYVMSHYFPVIVMSKRRGACCASALS